MDLNSFTSKPQLLVAVVTCLLLLLMALMFLQGNRLATHHAPLVDAIMEYKMELTTGHLWFEETMAGDQEKTLDELLGYFDSATWYADALMSGGENNEGRFYPIEDAELRAEVVATKLFLEELRQVAIQRYQNLKASLPGTDVDQQFDRMFTTLVDKLDHLETRIQNTIANDLERFYIISATIFFISVIASAYLFRHLHRVESEKARLYHELSDSLEIIQSKNAELEYKAHFDDLTKLPNRVLFHDRLAREKAVAERNKAAFSLLFIDLDHFKAVNDQHGHEAGDHVLAVVAERIQSHVRQSDTVSRLGGDEFAVILNGLASEQQAIETAGNLADKLLQSIRQPIPFGRQELRVSLSIGVAVYPDDGDEVEDLLRFSDTAMYQAKTRGKDGVVFFRNLSQPAH